MTQYMKRHYLAYKPLRDIIYKRVKDKTLNALTLGLEPKKKSE